MKTYLFAVLLCGVIDAPVMAQEKKTDIPFSVDEILQLCSKFEDASKKYCDYKKTDDKYLYCESAYGLDWITLRNNFYSLKAALKVKDWSSADSKYNVRASLKTIDTQSIKLQREDSEKVITVPVDKLDTSGQKVLASVQSSARQIKNALTIIEGGMRPQKVSVEQLTDEELSLLANSQQMVLPSKYGRLLNAMLADTTVVSSAIEHGSYSGIPQNRLTLLLKVNALTPVLKGHYEPFLQLGTSQSIMDSGGYFSEVAGALEDRSTPMSDDYIVLGFLSRLVAKSGTFEGKWGDSARRGWTEVQTVIDAKIEERKSAHAK